MTLQIPIVDMSSGLDHSKVVQELGQACQDWGFFQLQGHGFSPALRNDFFAAMNAFFALPKPLKQDLSRTDRNFWGYYDKELTKNKVDCKEIFDIDGNPDNLLDPDFAAAGHHRVPWPPALPELQPVVLQWLQQCEQLSRAILEAICCSLQQSPAVLYPFFIKNHSSFLRFNYYPRWQDRGNAGTTGGDSELGIHPHTDAGALTVLAQDDVPGLQVRKGSNWHTVIPVSDSLIINIGDMIQVWSNDRYVAPEHRVLASADHSRYSAPYFYNPSYETVCQPLIKGTEQSKYKPISWAEFRSGRAAGDYADLGEEIQISHYRIY